MNRRMDAGIDRAESVAADPLARASVDALMDAAPDVASNAALAESTLAPSRAAPIAPSRAATNRSSPAATKPLRVAIVGIGAWAAGRDGWPAFADALAGASGADPRGAVVSTATPRRPSPALLPPAERRRAPDGVAVALEVAREAVAMAGERIDATRLASVFASAHGDLAIVDYLCATLATDPALLSPTRFHLSVHNAAAGYWSIATRDRSPSNAIAAGDDTFAMALLEAATVAVAERRPVLLVAFDTAAVGLLAHVAPNSALFGFALVLDPVAAKPGPTRAEATLALSIESTSSALPSPQCPAMHALAASSASARAIALAEALARGGAARVRYPLGNATTLSIAVEPAAPARRSIG